MKLLLTGAFNYTDAQKEKLNNLGCDVTFVQDEREALNIDVSCFEAVVCNGLFLTNPIEKFENLKFIQVTSAGLDRLPLDYIEKKGIELKSARGVYSVPMAEWALTGVLSLYKNFKFFADNQKQSKWEKFRNIRELCGDTVCVIGCGSVGTECAKRFKAMGTTVLGVDIINPQNEVYDEFFLIEDIKTALQKSDVVVLTLPLTEKTKGFVNKELLDNFKDGAILVNIARGAIVDENALIECLNNKKLFGAVLDVFKDEPLCENSPLWSMDNVIVTPHNSFVSVKNNERLFKVIYDNLNTFIKGE